MGQSADAMPVFTASSGKQLLRCSFRPQNMEHSWKLDQYAYPQQAPQYQDGISAAGTSKSIQGSYTIQPAAFIHAALRYTFAEDKAMIQIKGNDLFNGSNHLKTKVRNGDQILDMDIANYMRNFTVSFSYKFGGYKKKEVKDVDISRFKH